MNTIQEDFESWWSDKFEGDGAITDWGKGVALMAWQASRESLVVPVINERAEAFNACPQTNCDWGSFYQGWMARLSLQLPVNSSFTPDWAGYRQGFKDGLAEAVEVKTK